MMVESRKGYAAFNNVKVGKECMFPISGVGRWELICKIVNIGVLLKVVDINGMGVGPAPYMVHDMHQRSKFREERGIHCWP